jgi:hypothetical protein
MERTGIVLLFWGLAAAWAQEYYPFSIQQDDITGVVDFGFLNRPLTPADAVFVRAGKFHRVGPDLRPNTEDDTPLRLFGVNLAFSANFPAEADAKRIAQRLRRLGVNLVRLHHLDTQPDQIVSAAASLLTTGPYPTLNPHSVDRLRGFLQALAEEGIYINLNLKVGYEFRPSIDGVPVHSPAMPTQSKPLHIFHPRMVALQQEFVRKVFDALPLRDNPALAMVEINNESSLLWEWQVTNLDTRITGEYLAELTEQWNGFLRTRHETTDHLRRAWTPSVVDGAQLLGPQWRLEQHSPASGVLATDNPSYLEVRIDRGGAPLIVKQTGFSIEEGKTYLAEVEMRADLPAGATRNVYWDVKQDVAPWRTATGRTVAVTSQWQRYSMLFTAPFSMEGIGRFGLSVENVGAVVQIRAALLRTAGERGIGEQESLEVGSVALVRTTENSSRGRMEDFLDFLAAADRAYLDRMREAIRESCGPLVPIAGTQIGYGGLMNIDSHRSLDYHDNHFYIDHYNFPNVAWDGRDWRIRDSSATGSGLGAILNVAAARPGGLPYTVSEFNQNWPNRQASEIDPLVSVIGAFQDWDSVMHFAYSHGRNWDDGVPNGFNLNGDWTKFAGFGQSAWLFRSGAIQKGRETVAIPVPRDQRLRATRERRNGNIAAFLSSAIGYQPTVALTHRVELSERAGVLAEPARRAPESILRSDTEEFQYHAQTGIFLLHSPWSAGVIGMLRRDAVISGPLSVELADSALGFVTLLVTPSDQKPLSESRRMLLSLPGQTLRTQPGSSAAAPQPQRLQNYPATTDWFTLQPEPGVNKPAGNLNGGQRPTFMERVECVIGLRSTAARITVYPLDGAGRRLRELGPESVQKTEAGFRIHLQAAGQEFSPWYELVLE